ncbi:hypothetical protein XENORESO_011921, partial [Xenotaenia resolanae]
SPPKSNPWRLEKRVEGYWRDFFLDVEDGVFEVTIEQILVFASGADKVPPLGCSPQPTLNFIQKAGLKYPEANTCLVNLKLPIHDTYRQFTKFMCDVIIQAPIFGLA